jgi:hypothetical protein
MGPSGNGLVERMKAGESPWDQGSSNGLPLSVSRRRSRGLRKTPRWGAERRAGPRYGPAIPSADGRGHAARQANGCGVPRPRISALRFPLFGIAKGSKPTIWHDSPPGCAARQHSRSGRTCTEKTTMPKFLQITCVTLHRHARAQPSEGRRRYARLCRGHPRLGAEVRRGWPGQARP